MPESYTANAATLNEENALDKIVFYAFDEATKKLEQSGELEPFTVILHGDNLHIESHPGEDVVDCFNSASRAAQLMEHVMEAYVFAYDGYVNTDSGTRDAIIAERGKPGDETAQAFALLYTMDDEGEGSLSFEEGIYDLGSSSSLLKGKEASEDDLEEF